MRKPTIDELLEKVDSIFELTMLAAKEATRIKLKDREEKEPLQRALERIAEGKVTGHYLEEDEIEEYEAKQRERKEIAAQLRERTFSPIPPPPVDPKSGKA